ncbi:MAG TPA: acyltransferase [Bacteroidales bacterium]|nr:acyltransferase [Bacteroidales bacterium]
MNTGERRYDIDWLRVIAIALLLVYHIGIVFQPWGVFIGFIQNFDPIEGLWIPMSMLNVWRIPLLFFISGMGVCFSMRKRNIKMLLLERSRRILLPFIFGITAIVPIHMLLWKAYYNQDLGYSINQGHLWFLANIFSYVLILAPVFILIKKKKEGKFYRFVNRVYSSPVGLIMIMLVFVAEAIILSPEVYETYSLTFHGWALGLLSFFFGFSFIYAGSSFWQTLDTWRWVCLFMAVALFTVRLSVFDLQAPSYLKAMESNLWIFTVLGFGARYLNRPSPALSYLSKSAYPVYIIHMIFLYLGSYLIIPTYLPAFVKFIIVTSFTFAGCIVFYEFVIRRVKVLRLLFGLK